MPFTPLLARSNYGTDHLPRPLQSRDRMLVMINAFTWNSTSTLFSFLNTLTSLCERGTEVHVIIYTVTPGLEGALFLDTQPHFVTRLQRSMPILVMTYSAGIGHGLAMVHRDTVTSNLNAFDYFMYTEDDLAIGLHHLRYLLHWTQTLLPHKMLPGLLRYEVAPPQPVSQNGHDADLSQILATNATSNGTAFASETRHPAILDEFPFPASIVELKRHHLLRTGNNYMAMWFLPRHPLAEFVALPGWYVYSLHPGLMRERSATLWLAPHFEFVVPVRHLEQAMVHHVSTRYASSGKDIFNFDAFDFIEDVQACIFPEDEVHKPRKDGHRRIHTQHARHALRGACMSCLNNASVPWLSLRDTRTDKWRALDTLKVQCVSRDKDLHDKLANELGTWRLAKLGRLQEPRLQSAALGR